MKKNRTIIISITLVSYFFFIFVINVSGIIDESSSQESKTDHEGKKIHALYSNIKMFSVFMGVEPNSGMDPTPNPPLPPELEVEIETD